MLVAYGPEGRPVVAEESSLEQLQQWSRERLLYCPNCRGIVHVRGGPEKRTQLHFAHQKGECAWSTETESVRHMRGKSVLAQWIREQYPAAVVTLEERLPGPNRIADLFVRHSDGQCWAIEFQCAPLEIEEWKRRHEAYRQAGIIDIWVIGNNRREKQEAFIEAIIASAREVMFLDPQVTPPRIWLRWPVSRAVAQEWQAGTLKTGQQYRTPSLEGWVGRTGYGASLIGSLYDVRLNKQGGLQHSVRTNLEKRAQLIQIMSHAGAPNEEHLAAYLRSRVEEKALQVVLLPLLRAYLRDPDLLRRYNYGRGQGQSHVLEADHVRVHNARTWLSSLTRHGFSQEHLHDLLKEVPFIGPYAAFASYIEMLLTLLHRPGKE